MKNWGHVLLNNLLLVKTQISRYISLIRCKLELRVPYFSQIYYPKVIAASGHSSWQQKQAIQISFLTSG